VVGRVASAVIASASPRVPIEDATTSNGTTYELLIINLIDTNSIFLEGVDGSFRGGAVEDLVVGASIRACHTGSELRSSPPQVNATRIDVRP
jgi:hypothetical protein